MPDWPPATCPTCGADDPTEGGRYCGGHKKKTENFHGRVSPHTHCHNGKGKGTDHPGYGRCISHGGASDAGRKFAQRLMGDQLEAAMLRTLAEVGYDRIDDPHEALVDISSKAVAFMGWCEELLGIMDPDALRFTDDKGGEQLRSEVALYERAMDRAAKIVDMVGRLGIDERRVRIAEVQTALLATVLDKALRSPAAGLNATQIAVVGDALHEQLDALEAAKP